MIVNTICLCGSTRFLDDFATANIELTKRGLSVISISFAMPKEPVTITPATRPIDLQPSEAEAPGLKEYLDLVHLNKILRSDAVFVVGDGYIGRSTAREILWAAMQGKAAIWQTAFGPDEWDEAAYRIRRSLSTPRIESAARKVLGL